MKETVFDRILKEEIPSAKVYEDDEVLAFKDINPQAPVHILVIPKKRIARFADLGEWSDEETGRFMKRIARVADSLGLSEKGYRIIINNGEDGGQEVDYLHAHILGGKRLPFPG